MENNETKFDHQNDDSSDSGCSDIIDQIVKNKQRLTQNSQENKDQYRKNTQRQTQEKFVPSFTKARYLSYEGQSEAPKVLQYDKKLAVHSKGSLINRELIKSSIKDLEDLGQKCGYGGGLDYKKRNQLQKGQTKAITNTKDTQQKQSQSALKIKQQFFQVQKNMKDRLNEHMGSKTNLQTQKSIQKQKFTTINDYKYDNKTINQRYFQEQQNEKLSVYESKFKPDETYVIDRNFIQSQKKLQIQGIDVFFPYEPYQAQINYMQNAITALKTSKNALLQSPTGTGKTLCLLASTLSWAEHHYKETKQQTKIIYLSRTHSQLSQVQNQLAKTCFRPTMSTFGSREQLCIKQQFEQLKGRDKVQACSKGIKLFLRYGKQSKIKLQFDNTEENNNGDKRQPYQTQNSNALQKMPKQQQQKTKAAMCHYYKSENYVLNLAKLNFQKKLMPIQKLKQKAYKHQFCPYYYPTNIKPICSLYFMPYNYLLDDTLFSRYADILSGSLIIFDQGHNVPEASCQGRSYSIAGRVFQDAIKQIDKNLNSSKASSQLGGVRFTYGQIMKTLLVQYKSILSNLKYYLQKQQYPPANSKYQQADDDKDLSKMFPSYLSYRCIYQMLYQPASDVQINIFNQLPTQNDHINLVCKFVAFIEPIVNDCLEICEALKQTHDGIFQNIEKVGFFLQKCMVLMRQNYAKKQWIQAEINHYRIKINYNSDKIWQLNLICLVPLLTFKQIKDTKPRSIIITSGTLSPLKVWSGQLKIPFPIQFSNTHVIKSSQLQLRIIKSGVMRNSMLFSFESLKNDGHAIYEDLLETLCAIVECIPNGVLVIVPSYKIMNQIQKILQKHSKLFHRLTIAKNVFFQIKGQFESLIKNYRKAALKQPGGLLFCVCRGKISQGIDFPNQLCRSVIFIGVPYPNIMDPIIGQKKKHLDIIKSKYGGDYLSGSQWYDMNTIRAVNQAIGRVIRHINDYGTIFLIDQRYDAPRLKNGLSGWVHKSLQVVQNFDQQDTCEDIRLFYCQMRKQYANFSSKIQQAEPIYQIDKQKLKLPKNAFQVIMSKKVSKKKQVKF